MPLLGFLLLFTLPTYLFLYIRIENEAKRRFPHYWESLGKKEGFLAYPSELAFHLAIFVPGRLPERLSEDHRSSIVWIRILDVYNMLAFIFIAYSELQLDAAKIGQ